MRLNLGCSDQKIEGFVGVDHVTPSWATAENFVRADLRHSWPFADSSIDHIRAYDIIEHLPDKIHTMNELFRILKPGGMVEIVVPTTDGRGAWQDPEHCSFWNRNSFFYFEEGNPHLTRFREGNGVKCAFRIKAEKTETLADGVVKLAILLEAVKMESSREAIRETPEAEKFTRAATLVPESLARKPIFSILHPSARPEQARKIFMAWMASCVNPGSVEYILVCDRKYYDKLPEGMIWNGAHSVKVVFSGEPHNYVANVNKAAALSTGEILIVIADDQFSCKEWDEELLEAISVGTMAHSIPPSQADYLLCVSTGTPREYEREICVMPILSRERYEKYGYVFYPGYESMYADNDLYAMAKRDGAIVEAHHLNFPHRHWLNGQREKDAADEAQNREEAYAIGEAIFRARKACDFGEVRIATTESADDVAKRMNIRNGLPMIAICTPGNVFGMEWVSAYADLLIHVMTNYNLAKLMGYTSDAGMIRSNITNRLIAAPVKVDYVLWLDDDNTLTVEQFEMLLADLREHPEYDSVSGWTWCGSDGEPEQNTATMSVGRVVDLEYTEDCDDVKFCHTRAFTPNEFQESQTDLVEIGYSGFPSVLMRFDLLKKAGKHPFVPFVDERCEFGKSGEDLAFFARTKIRSGARFAVDRRVYVPHYKRRAIEPAVVMQARRDGVLALK